LGRFVRRIVIALAGTVVTWGIVLTAGHVARDGGTFEFGHPTRSDGTVVERPYPALRLDAGDPAGSPWPLLVAPGKHGPTRSWRE
jgi:hypothetical protein